MHLGSHTGRGVRGRVSSGVWQEGELGGRQEAREGRTLQCHDKEMLFAWQETQRCVNAGTLRQVDTHLLQSKELDLPLSEFLGGGL